MKVFWTGALILAASLSWAAREASAQAAAYGAPTLLPMPALTPTDTLTAGQSLPNTGVSPYTTGVNSYNGVSNPVNPYAPGVSPYGSQLTNHQQPLMTENSLIAGASGASQFEQAVSGGCDTCGECCEPVCGHWFGVAAGLVMGRNRANPYWTTYETNNNANQLMNTQNAGADWAGGGQLTLGYMFGAACGCPTYGVGVTYWGLGQMDGFSSLQSGTDSLSTPMNLQTQTGDVLIGGVPAGFYFDNSSEHRISRNDRFNNFELNFFRGGWNYGRLQVLGLVGFRYFRFDERLGFTGVAANGTDEATLAIRSTNNMYGVQIGGYANYLLTDRFGLFAGPKVGIFSNQMITQTLLYNNAGATAYDIPGHKTDIAMIGELDAGFSYAFTRNLLGFVGYRVVGVSGVALSDNQYLPYLADTQGFSEVKQNGSLILHGVMMGTAFAF